MSALNDDVYRPCDRELRTGTIHQLAAETGLGVIFADLVNRSELVIIEFVGTTTPGLKNLTVQTGEGVDGRGQSILYAATRTRSPIGDRLVTELNAGAPRISRERQIRDEVDRRVAILRLTPRGTAVLAQVTLGCSYAEVGKRLALEKTLVCAVDIYGPVRAFRPKLFATLYRHTSAGMACNLGALVGGGITPPWWRHPSSPALAARRSLSAGGGQRGQPDRNLRLTGDARHRPCHRGYRRR